MPGQIEFSADEAKAMRNSQEEPEEDELSRAVGDSLKKALNMSGVVRQRRPSTTIDTDDSQYTPF
jgi:hypothetical protein